MFFPGLIICVPSSICTLKLKKTLNPPKTWKPKTLNFPPNLVFFHPRFCSVYTCHFRFADGADVVDVHVDVDIQRLICASTILRNRL